MKNVFLLLAFILSSNVWAADVLYRITFKGNFSGKTHRTFNFPMNPHFSPLVAIGHDANASFFPLGATASEGVKTVAETGNPKKLLGEIQTLMTAGFIKDFEVGDGPFGGTSSVEVVVTVDHASPLVSLITMIAPSPDWIVGLNGYSLLENGKFIKKRVVELFALDAGTDAGGYFLSDDKPLRLKQPIRLLTNVSGKPVKRPFATVTIEKL